MKTTTTTTRTKPVNPERTDKRKLSPAKVRQIRKLYNERPTLPELAAQFGVSKRTICSVIGRTYPYTE